MNTKLNPAGWVRLVLYVISACVGVGAVVANTLGHAELGTLLGTLAGAGAAITGGTAVVNLPKAPDQHTHAGNEVGVLVPAVLELAEAARVLSQPPKSAEADAPAGVNMSEYVRRQR